MNASLAGITPWLGTMHAYNARSERRSAVTLARDRPEIRVVDDQRGAPTSTRAIAEAVRDVLAKTSSSWPSGVYHMTCAGETTWLSEVFGLRLPRWEDSLEVSLRFP